MKVAAPVEVTANYVVFDGQEYNCIFARDIAARRQAEADLVAQHQEEAKVVQRPSGAPRVVAAADVEHETAGGFQHASDFLAERAKPVDVLGLVGRLLRSLLRGLHVTAGRLGLGHRGGPFVGHLVLALAGARGHGDDPASAPIIESAWKGSKCVPGFACQGHSPQGLFCSQGSWKRIPFIKHNLVLMLAKEAHLAGRHRSGPAH